jgi:hypothetical protein
MSWWATRAFPALVQWKNVKEILTAKMTSDCKYDLASFIRVYRKRNMINNFAIIV